MLFILGTLMIVYSIIQHSRMTTWFMRLPISLYLGWISVATIVNVFVVFQANGIQHLLGLNELAWTIIMLLVGAALGIMFTLKTETLFIRLFYLGLYCHCGETKWKSANCHYCYHLDCFISNCYYCGTD